MEKNSTLPSPRTLLALLVAVAIVVAALLVVLSQLGGPGAAQPRTSASSMRAFRRTGRLWAKTTLP